HGRDDPPRVCPRPDLQAARRRGPRGRLPHAAPDAVPLLQRLRRLALPGEVEAALGDLRRRLLRAVPLGAGGLRLAADHGRYPGPLSGLPGPVRLRSADAVQLQPADQARWLLPPERLARGPQPPAAGPGLLQGSAPAAALGRGPAGRRAARAAAPDLRAGL